MNENDDIVVDNCPKNKSNYENLSRKSVSGSKPDINELYEDAARHARQNYVPPPPALPAPPLVQYPPPVQ